MLFPNKVTLSGSGWPLPLGGSQFNPGQHSYKGPGRTRLTSSRRLCEGGDTRWSLKEERLSDGHEGEYDRRRGHRTVRKCDTACNNGNSKQLGLTLEQGVSEKVGAGDQRPAGLPP